MASFVVVIKEPIRRTDARIPVERIADALEPMLKARFPDHAFEFAEAAPGMLTNAFTAIPIVGTVGDEENPGYMEDPPPEDLRTSILDAIYAHEFPEDAWLPHGVETFPGTRGRLPRLRPT